MAENPPDVLEGETCPFCRKKTLTLTESETEVPFFGKLFVFSMKCDSCKYSKADVEAQERKEPCRYTFDIDGEDDLKVRVIRSSEGTIKIPHVGSIDPGPNAEGFVSNIEAVLNRFKTQIESLKANSDEEAYKKKAKNLLKKLQKVIWGQEKMKIIIEDPSGNSAIISEKAKRQKL